PFRNLSFDEANTNHIFDVSGSGVAFYGPADEMLPGWRLQNLEGQPTFVGDDAITLGLNFATLYDAKVYQDSRLPFYEEGRFSLGLWPDPSDAFSLSQSGDIPARAKSIHFVTFGGQLELRINNTPVEIS